MCVCVYISLFLLYIYSITIFYCYSQKTASMQKPCVKSQLMVHNINNNNKMKLLVVFSFSVFWQTFDVRGGIWFYLLGTNWIVKQARATGVSRGLILSWFHVQPQQLNFQTFICRFADWNVFVMPLLVFCKWGVHYDQTSHYNCAKNLSESSYPSQDY